jgi:hypothetical protein
MRRIKMKLIKLNKVRIGGIGEDCTIEWRKDIWINPDCIISIESVEAKIWNDKKKGYFAKPFGVITIIGDRQFNVTDNVAKIVEMINN